LPDGHEAGKTAAFEAALLATTNHWVLQHCEDELDRRGRLKLPLPDGY
jgi:hypothetical protein